MTDHSKAEEPPYIVGIGTSAGGLEALEKFFSSAPPLTGLAFVVIQHLSPEYKSHMVQLLSKYTPLSVFEAEDGMPVETNSIYLLPRRKNMTIFKGKLYTVDYNRSHGGLNLPIDIFFESLAHDQGERSVGIILSGTGSDGTRGIRAIKEQGGLVIAQDDSAKFDGMPRSAISTRLVDYILPPEKIAITLLKYIKHPSLAADGIFEVPIPVHDNQLAKLFAVVQASTGVDFTDYKPNTILRRIERRMTVNQIENLNDYVTVLQDSPDESRTLYKEFLIGVTRFFRDGEAFQKIQDTVIPGLLQGRSRQSQVRVWIPGCSTGEEAYSLAILFREHMEKTGQYFDIKIFATDLDKEALDFASRGVYQESVLADISTERLRNFFVKRGDTYEVLRPLRGLVVFAHQNLIKDPPFSKMDLISCRNLLIYLQPKLQQRVLSIFQFALNSDGYLFLGSSESVGDFADVFKTIDNKWKLFQFDGTIRPRLDQTQLTGRTESPRSVGVTAYRQPIAQGTDDWRTSDPVLRSLVEQVMPPCLVVDENGSIIHAFGDLEPYLKLPQGYRIDLNVRKMAREPLSLPLSTALHRTSQNEEEVVYSNIRLESGPEVNLTVRLFFEKNSRQRLFLIMFTPTDTPGGNPETAEIFSLPKGAAQRINVLEQELQYTKENLQATIEELETANEELQATNEELMAANEELQSTNEELQSVNEELITVNSEYQAKIMELTNLNDDVNNLLKSTDVGTIFLDANLHLRKFTPAAQREINILDQDIGRPFDHITHNLLDVDLLQIIQTVLDTLSPVTRQIETKSGRWYQLKGVPYRTHANQIEGVVLTLVDITAIKKAELIIENLEMSKRYLDAMKSVVVVVSHRHRVSFINQTGLRLLQRTGDDLVGSNWFETCVAPADQATAMATFNQLLNDLPDAQQQSESWLLDASGQQRRVAWDHTLLRDEKGQVMAVLNSGIDITRQRQAEISLRQSETHYRTMAANLPNGAVFLFDTDLRYLIADGVELRRLDQTPAHYEGKHLRDIVTGDIADTLEHHYRQALAGQEVSLDYHHPDDDSYYALQLVPVKDDQGQIIAGMALSQNITDRKRAALALSQREERLRLALKYSPMLMYQTDNHLRYVWIQPAYPGMSEVDILGKTDLELDLPPEEASQLMALKHQALQQNDGVRAEISLTLAGNRHTFDLNLEPMTAADGQVIGLTAAANDITETQQP